jgi:hypothetical protein
LFAEARAGFGFNGRPEEGVMLKSVLRRLDPALAVAFIALLVALGGTRFAAFSLPRNSVGAKQLKNDPVITRNS